jgi:hypothetical protein
MGFSTLYAILTKPTQDLSKYLLGKGILMAGVMAAKLGAMALGSSVIGPALAVAGGIVAWQTFRRYDSYKTYQYEMLETYRDDIAEAIGMDPARVTIEDMRSVAHGNELFGLPGNPILAHALNKQYNAGWLALATSVASAAVAFGLLSWLPGAAIIKDLVASSDSWEKAVHYGLTPAISLFSGMVVHKGLDSAIGYAYGFHTPTAHDHIVALQKTIGKGKKVTKEQVFDVFMAANPQFTKQLRADFDKGVPWFTNAEKNTAMKAVGVDTLMQHLADQINSNQMPASKLAFVMDGSSLKTLVNQQRKKEALAPALEQDRFAPKHSFVERFASDRAKTQRFTEMVEARAPESWIRT